MPHHWPAIGTPTHSRHLSAWHPIIVRHVAESAAAPDTDLGRIVKHPIDESGIEPSPTHMDAVHINTPGYLVSA
jgi:hypothetical protein